MRVCRDKKSCLNPRSELPYDGAMGSRLRVLIVDDNGLRQRAIRRFCRVRRVDLDWTHATTHAAACEHLASASFDRLLIDVHLGGRTQGLDVLRYARERRVLTPAIIYCDFLDQSASLSAQRLGACPLPFDGTGTELVDALIEPPFGAYGAFRAGDSSFNDWVRRFKLSYFEQALGERGGNIRGTARKLRISQQAAQYMVKMLHGRGDT